MILRRSLISHGRRATALTSRRWVRPMATESDLGSVDQSVNAVEQELQGLLSETKSIEARTQSLTEQQVPSIDPNTHTTQRLLQDGTAEALAFQKHQKKFADSLGTDIEPHYEPRLLINNPPRPRDITLELLMASQAHLGHKTSHWNPANSQYIFGIRQGIHIISLEATASYLRRACRVVTAVAERGGLILFVGTRDGQQRSVVEAAKRAKGCHVFSKWIPGSITNNLKILASCKTKLVDEFDRPIPGYEKELSQRATLKPDLVVVLNPIENWVLLHECGLTNIPTIGVLDTNADPTWLTYPIPANDDSLRCTQLIAGVLGRAAEEGHASRREMAEHGQVPYEPVTDLKSDAELENILNKEANIDQNGEPLSAL